MLAWAGPPSSIPTDWSPDATQCAASNCGDSSALSRIILPNSGRDETVQLYSSENTQCLKNVFVMLSVEPNCVFTSIIP